MHCRGGSPWHLRGGTASANAPVWELQVAVVPGKDMLRCLSELSCMHVQSTHIHIWTPRNLKTKKLCQVYAATWWMMHYDHPTPKRQQARSNWKGVRGLDLGSIPAAVMREKTQFQSTRVVPSNCVGRKVHA